MKRICMMLRGGEPGVDGDPEADELCEYYRAPEERQRLVAGYVRAPPRRIAELARVSSLEDVEDPETFLEIREADRTDCFSWPRAKGR